jgi:hypothetical protein
MLVLPFMAQVEAEDGTRFTGSVYGREREDGAWEGWLEFRAAGRDLVLRTDRETTQSTYDDLAYWASGLETTYLEGAFKRAQSNTPQAAPVSQPAPRGKEVR